MKKGASANRLYDFIRQRISDGTYRVGTQLPKIDHFAIERHLSRTTVLTAYRRLQEERQIFLQGRKWFVGSEKPASYAHHSAKMQKVILLICQRDDQARNLFVSEHTHRFFVPLYEEIARYGIRLYPMALHARDKNHPGIEVGHAEIVSRARLLGSRYFGSIITFGDMEFQNDVSLAGLIKQLCALGQPVTYFDSTNTAHTLTRRALKAGTNYVRIESNEEEAIRIALQTLYDNGHRVIACPDINREVLGSYRHNESVLPPNVVRDRSLFGIRKYWTTKRVDRLKKVAASGFPDMKIHSPVHQENFWSLWVSSNVPRLIERISQAKHYESSTALPTSQKQRLLQMTPSLKKILSIPVSAIVALNDHIAHDYLEWLSFAGIQVPAQLSIVAFDNSSSNAVHPISTIDFGFSNLAYLAAHLFIGDIAPTLSSSGTITGKPFLVDRNSVAPERETHKVTL